MSKDRETTEKFVVRLIVEYDRLSERFGNDGKGLVEELEELVDQRDRETRNMACMELIGLAEDLIVAPVAPEPTIQDVWGTQEGKTPV